MKLKKLTEAGDARNQALVEYKKLAKATEPKEFMLETYDDWREFLNAISSIFTA